MPVYVPFWWVKWLELMRRHGKLLVPTFQNMGTIDKDMAGTNKVPTGTLSETPPPPGGLNALPETFVDHAEEIWAMLAEGKTQQQAADEMGWSREKVKDYVRLQNINAETWEIIGATFQNIAPNTQNRSAPQNGAVAPISEGLLRSITCLQPDHQHELVTDLINGEITKAKFNPAWL